jgi:hypothetical protein
MRYIVNSRPSSATIAEWPVPSGRLQMTRGPASGHLLESPVASTMKLRFGPPHCRHAAVDEGEPRGLSTWPPCVSARPDG